LLELIFNHFEGIDVLLQLCDHFLDEISEGIELAVGVLPASD
jgi:hypothetical protein